MADLSPGRMPIGYGGGGTNEGRKVTCEGIRIVSDRCSSLVLAVFVVVGVSCSCVVVYLLCYCAVVVCHGIRMVR